MRTLLVVCLLAGTATADELPTIDTEFPPALRITSKVWNVKLERVGVAIHAAPDVTFVTLAVTGREQEIQLDIDVPIGTKAVGLGFEGVERSAWGRPMPRANAVDRHRSGALLVRDSASADRENLTLHVTVPATVEIALRLPPLPRLAIETTASALVVEVAGEKIANKQKRVVVELEDMAGTTGELEMPSVTETIALVASPAAPTDFFLPIQHHMRGPRDLDKAMIRRRMKWYRPGLRECFMREAQWGNSVRRGGVVLSFMILASGSVESASTSESDLPASVNTCLVEQLLTWEFPAADGNVQVNYPVTFGLYGE
ncbi:MAG: AgmX/PglI C-terminal domain-containing protein [Myxococcota bacterium]|nr:AgmX/PglI C-terminal domain-containing protein [Myxococcota bacterium]